MLELARIRLVTATLCDIQSAIAGGMRIKVCWAAFATFALKSLASSGSAALSAGSVPATDMMRLSGQFLTPHRPIGIRMPPRFTLGNGEANSLRLLSSRAGEISGSTLLDARLPPGLGIAALGGCACRSRAVEPDHAPTSKGWEHDLLPCAVPAAHARLSLKPRISHGSSATCKPS